MDDPSALPWPTDKKLPLFVWSSSFLSLFLPYTSLKAQLQSFVTPGIKSFFSQDSLQGPILQPFWALPEEQEASWCRHISSAPLLRRSSLFLDNRFLPEAHRNEWGRVSSSSRVHLCVCERRRQKSNTAVVNYCCNMKIWIHFYSCWSHFVSVTCVSTSWLRYAVALFHKTTRDNITMTERRTLWAHLSLSFQLISACVPRSRLLCG